MVFRAVDAVPNEACCGLHLGIKVSRHNKGVTTRHALDGSCATVKEVLSSVLVLFRFVRVCPDMLVDVKGFDCRAVLADLNPEDPARNDFLMSNHG